MQMVAKQDEKPVKDIQNAEAAARSRQSAERALAEAAARRTESTTPRPKEISGREGPEPTRYGDWENRGIASDF
jgi:hypothetical protein